MKYSFFFLFLLPLSLFAQKKSVYVTAGTLAAYHTVNVNFEHNLRCTESGSGLYSIVSGGYMSSSFSGFGEDRASLFS